MSKTGKILLGIVTFIPTALFITYILFCFTLFTSIFHQATEHPGQPPEFMMNYFGGLMLIIGLAIISSIGLLIFYLIHIINNPRLDNTERLIWVLIVIFANAIGYIVYFFMRIASVPQKTAYQS